uniref:Uncharacterized protein n=1 Tax=Steinernema glaseri TaxID=37863 RepID=A0A1I8AK38_9BILA
MMPSSDLDPLGLSEYQLRRRGFQEDVTEGKWKGNEVTSSVSSELGSSTTLQDGSNEVKVLLRKLGGFPDRLFPESDASSDKFKDRNIKQRIKEPLFPLVGT